MILPTWLVLMLQTASPATTGQHPATVDADDQAAIVIVAGGYRPFSLRDPFRPEPFWLLMAGLCEQVHPRVVAVYGRDLPDVLAAITATTRARGFRRIAHVEFWSHGGPGYFRVNHHRYRAAIFSGSQPGPALARLRAQLTDHAVVYWRCCSTFHGNAGRRFAQAASDYFNATGKSITVNGHTRPVGLTFPGRRALLPGRAPRWLPTEGRSERHLRGAAILARDLLRIVTGTLYDVIPHLRDRGFQFMSGARHPDRVGQ